MSSNNLNKKLEEVVKGIRIDEPVAKAKCQAVEDFSEALIRAANRIDLLFSDLFSSKSIGGSFYEGLAVKTPDDFQLNLILKLPFNQQQIQVSRDLPGRAQIQVIGNVAEILKDFSSKWTPLLYQKLNVFFYYSGKLSQMKFHKWIEDCLNKAFESKWFKTPPSILNISRNTNATGFTYHINTKTGDEVDVNVNSVLTGACYSVADGIHYGNKLCDLETEHHEVYLIIKPPKNSNDLRGDQNLRMDFLISERQMLKVEGCFQWLIKLCKLLQEKNQWNISSMQIKHLFLLEISSRPYWLNEKLGELFVVMLKKWQSAVQRRNLPFYFDRSENLFKDLNQQEAQQISNKLGIIISAISRNSNNISHYL